MADDCRGYGFGSVFLSFVAGAAIGGVVALLAAPRSGEETREKIKDAADEFREKMKKITDEAEARVREAIKEGQDVFQEKKEMIRSAFEAGKEAMETEKTKGKA